MSYFDEYPDFSFSEKEAYIGHHFSYMFCGYNMDRIDADDSLTDSQKEELKQHLFYYGD